METSVEALRARFAGAPGGSAQPERDRLEVVQRIANAIPDQDESFVRATRLVAQLLGKPFAAFSLVHDVQQKIKAAFGIEVGDTGDEGVFCRLCVASGGLLVVPDAAEDPRFQTNPMVTGPLQLRFYAGMPVRAPDGTTVGTLCVIDQQPGALTSAQERILYDMRSMIEELIALRALSIHDPLTGLFNRRHFDDQLALEWDRCAHSGEDLSIVMIDVDHFKSYNDAYGHPRGDACLQRVAKLLRTHVNRTGEVSARYGGEEFIVMMPRTGNAEGVKWASRFCAAVEHLSDPHSGSPLGKLTVSCGSAASSGLFRKRGGAAELVSKADAALYLSKRSGRNRAMGHEALASPAVASILSDAPRRFERTAAFGAASG